MMLKDTRGALGWPETATAFLQKSGGYCFFSEALCLELGVIVLFDRFIRLLASML